MKITIPGNPISVNHYTANTKFGRKYLTKKAKEYQKVVKESSAHITEKYLGEVIMSIKYHFGDKRRRDIDNYSKVILDCLEGVCYIDDKQVSKLSLEKHYDKENPRTEVEINELPI
tara:strand:- start:956 stop:1303 length:348 start_codon:yes stop_codon:yes gene_type:complete